MGPFSSLLLSLSIFSASLSRCRVLLIVPLIVTENAATTIAFLELVVLPPVQASLQATEWALDATFTTVIFVVWLRTFRHMCPCIIAGEDNDMPVGTHKTGPTGIVDTQRCSRRTGGAVPPRSQ